jgi:hypothetical protein
MAKTVIGILENPSVAQQAVEELLKSGFQRRDIGIISSDLLRETAAAAAGASKGMAFGALAGMLLSATTKLIPGFGPILVAGPGLTLLGGSTLGALAGGIVGALKSRGVPEEQANLYAEGVQRGGTLITVNASTDELAQRAVKTLKRHGAVNIEQRVADWKSLGWGGRIQRRARRAKKTAAAKPTQAKTPAPGPGEASVEAQPLDVSPVAPLAAVEVYSLVIEMPDAEESAAAEEKPATAEESAATEEAGTAPQGERRISSEP